MSQFVLQGKTLFSARYQESPSLENKEKADQMQKYAEAYYDQHQRSSQPNKINIFEAGQAQNIYSHPQYQTLIRDIQAWNQLVGSNPASLIKSLKNNPKRLEILYKQLAMFLRTITNTNNQKLQLFHLQKVFTWFTQEKCLLTNGTAKLLKVKPDDIKDKKQMPPRQQEELFQTYSTPQLTVHPKQRLLDYQRKLLITPDLSTRANSQDLLRNTVSSFNPGSLMRPLIQEIHPLNSQKDEEVVEDKEKKLVQAYDALDKRWVVSRNRSVQQLKENEENKEHMRKWAKNKSRVAKEIDRSIESNRYGNQFEKLGYNKSGDNTDLAKDSDLVEKMNQYQKKQENGGQTLESQVKIRDITQQALRQQPPRIPPGLLAPLKSKIHLQPSPFNVSDSVDEGAIERGEGVHDLSEVKVKKLRKQKEQRKSRAERVERDVNEIKLVDLRKQYRKLVDLKPQKNIYGEEEAEDENFDSPIKQFRHSIQNFTFSPEKSGQKEGPASLSIYNQLEPRIHPYKTYSSIFNLNQIPALQTQQFNEVRHIKKKIVMHGVNISTKTLTQALVVPSGNGSGPQFLLPKPCSAMFENPFFVPSKKKNKSKKKKKKD